MTTATVLPPGQHTLTLPHGGLMRHALVHVPLGAAAALPVVLLFHGSGGTGAWALRETRWDELADREGVIVVCPDATRPDPNAPVRFYTNPPVWNDGSARPPADRVTADDVGFVRALLDRFPTDGRVFVTGFSNGAAMTFRLGAELSDRISAIAPVAGHCWPTIAKPRRPVPTLFLTGDRDPLVPPAGGSVTTPWGKDVDKPSIRESLRRWSERLGGPADPAVVRGDGVTVERYGEWLEAWVIGGLGHHWPGGRAGLNLRIAGPSSDRVDATAEIWRFFSSKAASG